MRLICVGLVLLIVAGCARLDHIGKPPTLSETARSTEVVAMRSPDPVASFVTRSPASQSSLWSAGQQSLLGDQRAAKRGDILTVVIEIDERAEISNSSERSRTSGENLSVPQLLGLPQRIDPELPLGASLANAVDLSSSSSSGGDGSVSRREKLTLRIAATVVDALPNGVLAIEGLQEVRVNFELRELLVSGYVRPEDISRQNEITYDKIASARISYGGRGQITDVQQPRIGQQVLDVVLPF
ncbi:flagellar basal body L-ring protein FlgH [Roseobacteraceae bacterium S113]